MWIFHAWQPDATGDEVTSVWPRGESRGALLCCQLGTVHSSAAFVTGWRASSVCVGSLEQCLLSWQPAEGKAAIQRDHCELEKWSEAGEVLDSGGVLQRESFTPTNLQPGAAPRERLCGTEPGPPQCCGGQKEHKSAVHPCGRRASLNAALP